MSSEERQRRLHRALGHESSSYESSSYEYDTQGSGKSAYEEHYAPGSGSRRASSRRSRSSYGATQTRSSAAGRSYSGSSRRSGGSRSGGSSSPLPWVILLLVLGALLAFLAFKGISSLIGKEPKEPAESTQASQVTETETTPEETTAPAPELAAVMDEARHYALQYNYDEALKLLSGSGVPQDDQGVIRLKEEITAEKESCVEQNISEITHVFFHILCVDPENSFDERRWGKQAGGYNSLMTTVDEFKKMIQEMYDRGFVLVSLHDMAKPVMVDGKEVMQKGKIMLPPGKKAFVMSEDDVCYYEYMVGAGYADKMIIGEDGRPTTHYTDKDGNEFVGDYDIVSILDKFMDEHPDFSYHGHKACLVFTGYNGVLGYRTDETYLPENYVKHKVEGGHDVEAERKEAIEVMKALVADGYDLGSHSWGHRDMGGMSVENLKIDSDKWDRNVNILIREATGKPADILIYPKGADIGDWRNYDSSNKKEGCVEKFNYLYGLGFRYFCNVDSTRYWVQLGNNYLRTGRRALDGYCMWLVLSGKKPDLMSDLFADLNQIFDKRRPTPVPSY